MKTIGDLLKEGRQKKRLSISKLEDITKIKSGFIEAIEEVNWKTLPDFSVILGFVKSLSQNLGIEEKKAIALLKRDYSLKKEKLVNPKPDILNKFSWTPKLTFWLGAGIILSTVFGYLLVQYKGFMSPPFLEVSLPKEGEVVKSLNVKVIGKTSDDAVIKVNNQPVLVDNDGNFTTEIKIFEGTDKIEVKAISRSGKETIISRNIKPEI